MLLSTFSYLNLVNPNGEPLAEQTVVLVGLRFKSAETAEGRFQVSFPLRSVAIGAKKRCKLEDSGL